MLKKILRHLKIMISDFWNNFIASGVVCPILLRPTLYRISGNKIGKKCYISPRCFIGPGKGKLIVGDNTFINYGCFFDLNDDIIIGNNCNIAMNVHFVNGTHKIGDKNKRASDGISKKIYIGDGTWIGTDSTIMPGVNIGAGTIIGAGSLVLKDCESNSIYVGRPARLYKKLDDDLNNDDEYNN